MRHAAPRLSSWWPSLRERACACWTSAGRELLDAAAREADRGAGDRERRDRVAVAAEDGRRERGQADLELVDGGRVAARANRCQILGVAVLGGRCAPGEEDLAVRGQVVRDALPDPVRRADEVPAVPLGELVDAERRRDAEVHGLAGLLRERVEMVVREVDQRDVGLGALGEAEEDRSGPHRAAVAVALEQSLPLERGEEPGGRALGQLGGLGELADSERPRALDHAHEQLRGPVDCLASGHNPYYGTSVPPSASRSTLRGSAACS